MTHGVFQVHFGNVTTGASDDLRRVTMIVYQMVQVYGMNKRIGQVAFPREEGDWPQNRLYCDATAQMVFYLAHHRISAMNTDSGPLFIVFFLFVFRIYCRWTRRCG